MWFFHHDFRFEVPDQWWAEAGLADSLPSGNSYQADLTAFPGRNTYLVRIDEVEPVPRQLSHGVFNNDSQAGLSARDRVVRIFRGFTTGAAIPPVEVVMLSAGSVYKYRLTHGAHRFYCALAFGFSEVPAIDGFDVGSL
jgi:hypothetical protein